MGEPSGFKIADFGWEPEDMPGPTTGKMYCQVTIHWQDPRLWRKGEIAPIDGIDTPSGAVYALIRDHGNAIQTNNIQYIGKTEALDTRFNNHQKALEIVETNGDTSLSIGVIEFAEYHRTDDISHDLEEIEHILIWALNPPLNEKKNETLPCRGVNGGKPMLLINDGYRFSGRMPLEIVYPWMLIKPGRDHSYKTTM